MSDSRWNAHQRSADSKRRFGRSRFAHAPRRSQARSVHITSCIHSFALIMIVVTRCITQELAALGDEFKEAALMARQRFDFRKCGHESQPIGARRCIQSMITSNHNAHHYMAMVELIVDICMSLVEGEVELVRGPSRYSSRTLRVLSKTVVYLYCELPTIACVHRCSAVKASMQTSGTPPLCNKHFSYVSIS